MTATTMGCLPDGLDAGETQPSVLSWLDLAHSATPVVALERPFAGIARFVIAPVPLLWLPGARRSVHHDSRRPRCLAVNDTGHLASSDLVFAGNAEALLAAVRQSLKGPGTPEPAGCLLLDTAVALRDLVPWRL